jgi:hypothetical protein
MSDDLSNYMGGHRHAPKPEIGSMSQDDVGGTSHILNAAGRTQRKPHGGHVLGPSPIGTSLHLGNMAEILHNSGLARRRSTAHPGDDELDAEGMSDADEPSQTIRANDDGSMTHYRRTASGSVASSAVGAPDFFQEPL